MSELPEFLHLSDEVKEALAARIRALPIAFFSQRAASSLVKGFRVSQKTLPTLRQRLIDQLDHPQSFSENTVRLLRSAALTTQFIVPISEEVLTDRDGFNVLCQAFGGANLVAAMLFDTRDAVSAAILKQKDGVAYLFFDSDMQKSLKATNSYIRQRYCLTGATLDEIAGLMKVDPAVLKATMEDWKKAKSSGNDPFGRTDMPRNLDVGPFYAIAVTPAVHHTMGGIQIDKKTRVYDKSGRVIPGLFAAGEVTGGIHGANRLGGNAQADIVTFGRIAGEEAFVYSKSAAN